MRSRTPTPSGVSVPTSTGVGTARPVSTIADPIAAPPTKKQRTRGYNYKADEIQTLLRLCGEILPIGAEWEKIEADFNAAHPDPGRDQMSLRRKFNEYCNSKMPTGDPSCPPEVRTAKQTLRLIEKKSHATDGNLLQDDLQIEFPNSYEDDDASLFEDLSQERSGNITNIAVSIPSTKVASRNGFSSSTSSFITPRKSSSTSNSSVENLVQYMMIKDQQDRERQLERDEKDRREREERAEERRARERADRRRDDQRFMLMMMMMNKSNGSMDPTILKDFMKDDEN